MVGWPLSLANCGFFFDLCDMGLAKRRLELLAPAKDLQTGMSAIDCGADAVYIGPERFGARASAGNSVEDIGRLCQYAHLYKAKIYATVNTLLFDHELDEVRSLIYRLYEVGVDAIIVQDAGILEMDLPPMAIHASTQFHNYSVEKVRFLENNGLARVVLARELSLDQIKKIYEATSIELEYFIHGALCVSLSGQCYMSYALTGRSANRGECAQSCRSYYSLFDEGGSMVAKSKHVLSLHDLNLSHRLGDLALAGITSFKIEGRMKDINYVRNTVTTYHKELNEFIAENDQFCRASEGVVDPGFNPDLKRSFNRGFTTYFLDGRQSGIFTPDSSRSLGEFLGLVRTVSHNHFTIENEGAMPVNGDGISFLAASNRQSGTRVNRVEGRRIYPLSMDGIEPGAKVYRNADRLFQKQVESAKPKRRIAIAGSLSRMEDELIFTVHDHSGNRCSVTRYSDFSNSDQSQDDFERFVLGQLSKSGDTPFMFSHLEVLIRPIVIRSADLNQMRRDALSELEKLRLGAVLSSLPVEARTKEDRPLADYPSKILDARGNVTNELARQFYLKRRVEVIEKGVEIGGVTADLPLMTTRHCLRYAFGKCPKENKTVPNPPPSWHMTDQINRYRLDFHCRDCMMAIYKTEQP